MSFRRSMAASVLNLRLIFIFHGLLRDFLPQFLLFKVAFQPIALLLYGTHA